MDRVPSMNYILLIHDSHIKSLPQISLRQA